MDARSDAIVRIATLTQKALKKYGVGIWTAKRTVDQDDLAHYNTWQQQRRARAFSADAFDYTNGAIAFHCFNPEEFRSTTADIYRQELSKADKHLRLCKLHMLCDELIIMINLYEQLGTDPNDPRYRSLYETLSAKALADNHTGNDRVFTFVTAKIDAIQTTITSAKEHLLFAFNELFAFNRDPATAVLDRWVFMMREDKGFLQGLSEEEITFLTEQTRSIDWQGDPKALRYLHQIETLKQVEHEGKSEGERLLDAYHSTTRKRLLFSKRETRQQQKGSISIALKDKAIPSNIKLAVLAHVYTEVEEERWLRFRPSSMQLVVTQLFCRIGPRRLQNIRGNKKDVDKASEYIQAPENFAPLMQELDASLRGYPFDEEKTPELVDDKSESGDNESENNDAMSVSFSQLSASSIGLETVQELTSLTECLGTSIMARYRYLDRINDFKQMVEDDTYFKLRKRFNPNYISPAHIVINIIERVLGLIHNWHELQQHFDRIQNTTYTQNYGQSADNLENGSWVFITDEDRRNLKTYETKRLLYIKFMLAAVVIYAKAYLNHHQINRFDRFFDNIFTALQYTILDGSNYRIATTTVEPPFDMIREFAKPLLNGYYPGSVGYREETASPEGRTGGAEESKGGQSEAIRNGEETSEKHEPDQSAFETPTYKIALNKHTLISPAQNDKGLKVTPFDRYMLHDIDAGRRI